MKIKFLLIIILFMVSGYCNAQDPQFSQNMFTQLAFNPGYAGSSGKINVAALNRNQWMGFSDFSPTTTVFHFDAAINPFKRLPSGIGLTFLNDAYGFTSDFGIELAYAYKMRLKKGGTLGIGINGGIFNSSLSADWLDPGGGDGSGDVAIPQGEETAMAIDFGFGLYYYTQDLYFGISSTHINEPKFKYEDTSPILKRHYYIMAGYRMEMSNPSFEFYPSMFVQTDGATTLLSANTTFTYNKKLWAGVSFRTDNALTGMIGAVILDWFKVGYAYDYTLSDLSSHNSGSHEILMGFSFDIKRDKTPQQYKSIRYL